MSDLEARIETSWATGTIDRDAVEEVIAALDQGRLRVASKGADGEWVVHAVAEAGDPAVLPRSRRCGRDGSASTSTTTRSRSRRDLAAQGVRVVPPGTVRYGAFLEPGCVVMPGYVNIGAYVGAGTMVDTWATVGSCAQIGKGVHLSGGVGIGGVLEPPGAVPVIVEDGCFVGSRAIVVEGVHLEEEVVIGAGVTITGSTPIVDVTGPVEVVLKGRVPARSVVIPGTRKKRFPAGEYDLPCALIIGRRTASTDRKTTLESALREFSLPV